MANITVDLQDPAFVLSSDWPLQGQLSVFICAMPPATHTKFVTTEPTLEGGPKLVLF